MTQVNFISNKIRSSHTGWMPCATTYLQRQCSTATYDDETIHYTSKTKSLKRLSWPRLVVAKAGPVKNLHTLEEVKKGNKATPSKHKLN